MNSVVLGENRYASTINKPRFSQGEMMAVKHISLTEYFCNSFPDSPLGVSSLFSPLTGLIFDLLPLQTIVMLSALLTCYSRITDNWHHWSDVLAGVIVGALVAVYTVGTPWRESNTDFHKFWHFPV